MDALYIQNGCKYALNHQARYIVAYSVHFKEYLFICMFYTLRMSFIAFCWLLKYVKITTDYIIDSRLVCLNQLQPIIGCNFLPIEQH